MVCDRREPLPLSVGRHSSLLRRTDAPSRVSADGKGRTRASTTGVS